MKDARQKIREVAAQERMEIAEVVKATEVQMMLSKAMVREAEDEAHTLRLKVKIEDFY